MDFCLSIRRWRKLGGGAPIPEEILRRSEALGCQLEAKRKQLEARQLVLVELDHLAAFLTHEAALSMPGILHLQDEVSLHCPEFGFPTSRYADKNNSIEETTCGQGKILKAAAKRSQSQLATCLFANCSGAARLLGLTEA